MRIKNTFYAGMISAVIITVFILGCVKTPTDAPPLPDFKAKIRIIHAASDVAQASVLMDGQSKATLAFGEGSAYSMINAGNRVFRLQDQSAETLFVDTDFSGTIFVANKADAASKRFMKGKERWLYSPPIPDTLAAVIVAQMTTDTLTISINNDTTWTAPDAKGAYYFNKVLVPAGNNTLYITSGEDTLSTVDANFQGRSSTTYVLCGSKANLTIRQFANE